ncbi:MAG: tripartite tricarboxylate transporter TctB family protein [Acetobacteraceae bacterium]|nr:tripartite tricarboxylate transporter TctB family protein [Acetobacteraceae bacterium]
MPGDSRLDDGWSNAASMDQLQATRTRKSPFAGLLLLSLGLAAGLVALGLPFRLPNGRPGPGFMPQILAGALVAIGALALLAGPRGSGEASATPRPGLLFVLAIGAFAATLPAFGVLPAALLVAAMALAAAPGLPWPKLVGSAVAIAVPATWLFLGLLGVPGSWIGPR